MPRAPYYNGPITAGGGAYAAPAKPSLLQSVLAPAAGMLLGDGIGGMVAGRFRDPNTDPNAQRARQLAAEAALKEEELARVRRGEAAMQGMGDTFGAYTRNLRERIGDGPLRPDQQAALSRVMSGALQGAVAAGADPEQARSVAQAFAMQFGADFGDNTIARVNSMGGTYLGDDESVSVDGQTRMLDANRAQETAIQDSINTTDLGRSRIAADADMYGSRTAAGATLGSAQIGATASENNNRRNNVSAERRNAYNRAIETYRGALPQSRTTTGPDGTTTVQTSGRVATFGGGAVARGGRGAPAPPVSALREGEETVFDNGQVWTLRNGRPVQVE
jgi:hypothetical protein